jgi:hypothetical protein
VGWNAALSQALAQVARSLLGRAAMLALRRLSRACLAAVLLVLTFTRAVLAQASPPTEEVAHIELREGLRVISPHHSATFRVLSQFRYLDTHDAGQHTAGFQLSMLRPSMRGSFFDGLVGVFIQPELAGDRGRVLDAELTLHAHAGFSLTLGQFITPASREFMTPVPVLLFPDFSIVSVAFREGRDVGGMVSGTFFDGRLSYYAALVNGNGIGAPSNDGAGLRLVSRLEVMPLGAVAYDTTQTLSGHSPVRFSLAADSYVDLVDRGDAVVGADATLVAGPVMFLTEAYLGWQQDRATQRRGAYAELGVTIVPDRLQLGLRASALDPNLDAGGDSVRTLEGLVALYAFGNHAKLALRYAHAHVGPASMTTTPEHALTAQVQGWL